MEIWTLTAGLPGPQELSPFALDMHRQWGTGSADETVRVRREEDRWAAARLGARPFHFGFFDCIYRKDEAGQPLYSDAMYVSAHSCDAELPRRMAQALRSKLEDEDVVICQLGIGEHVDHLLVRSAAELLERPLLYDADIPYLLNHPDELAPRTTSMVQSVLPVSGDGFAAWVDAIQEYRSQLSTLFEGPEDLQARMRAYWESERGIRLWSSQAGVSPGV